MANKSSAAMSRGTAGMSARATVARNLREAQRNQGEVVHSRGGAIPRRNDFA